MTNPPGTTILPDFLRFTGTHTDHSISTLKWPIQELPSKKSWEIWRKLLRKQFLLSKRSRLGVATLETPLGPFLPTHDNHHSWHWEQTGANTIVENTHVFNTHQQVHYKAHQIKVNQSDKLHNTQPIRHGHPIMMWQSTDMTWVFAWPRSTPNDCNLHRPKQVILRDLYKTEMLKLVKYRHLSMPDTQAIAHKTIVIGIASKQWGARANFEWCTTYQGDDHQHPLGSRAGSVMITSSYNDRTRADLHALQAALLFLQMQLTHIFQEQLHFHTVTKHKAPLTGLVHILKIETHNPQWRLNRNWDILNSIMHNIHIHQLNWYLGQYNNITHVNSQHPNHGI
jgi:hypothetical protein